ncbi:stage V sporulation protein AD [Alicyclobacillus cellulosilyticus]|uniref:Stage V sporulation protein AD n=1 Tax=Alicyclobacillus cellulosilyticus TaxID=1003997 RepID=A0A917NEX0_9BACL|nr:stage V sporulation protein AD [Alicyclobacillus cellulosilyticus]GGI95577.1 stage V sporulation protein AD [Alicyclobacillus cellulosilyticus]
MPKSGRQTWVFASAPRVISRATVAGKNESQGPLGTCFDIRHHDDRMGEDTWEHAERALADEAFALALAKANLKPEDIDLVVGADLNAQLISYFFSLRHYAVPAMGMYAACASICQSLAVGALAIDSGMAERVLVGTSSHFSTAERQFRFPTEYGAQKPPSAQRTVTGSGAAVLARTGSPIAITMATVGQVLDYGLESPWEMNAAMAPAAAATIAAHLADTGRTLADYDCVATGDLGFVGHEILCDLLKERGIAVPDNVTDCGMLIFDRNQPEVYSGGSGCACCTMVTFGYLLRKLEEGEWRRILVAATGALLSMVSVQQQDTIPCISHAVVFERKEDGS